MKWLDVRVEVLSPAGEPVIYPSFVRELSGGVANGVVSDLIDCWCPDQVGEPLLDFAQGQTHFMASYQVAVAHNNSSFLGHVLSAMAVRGNFGPIEKGFVSELLSRCFVGSGPAFSECIHPSHISADMLAKHRITAWDFIYVCREGDSWDLIADEIERIMVEEIRGPWDFVFLSALAGMAFNGAKH